MKKDEKTNASMDDTSTIASVEESESANDDAQQLPPNVDKLKKRRWLPYVIMAAVLAVATVLVGWARGGFTKTETRELLIAWCDGFFVPGLLGIAFGVLVLASNGGAFDMLAYGLRRFFGLFRKDPIDRKYNTYYDYQQSRKEKKRSFWYMIIVGGAYLLVGVILFVVYFTMLAR